jgi:hypothetical protein
LIGLGIFNDVRSLDLSLKTDHPVTLSADTPTFGSCDHHTTIGSEIIAIDCCGQMGRPLGVAWLLRADVPPQVTAIGDCLYVPRMQ